jgi:hypothetical protein
MRSNRLTSFTQCIKGSLDYDGTWKCGIGRFYGGFYFAYVLVDLSPMENHIVTSFMTSSDKPRGGGVSLCTESAVRLLIGH